MDVEVYLGSEPGTVWIEVENFDPVDGRLYWAVVSSERARQIANELLAIADDADTRKTAEGGDKS